MNSPFFSIILPNFNSEEFIEKTIQSIINNSFQSWELIAVDDHSQDKSLNIINDYSKKDSRIKLFHNDSKGVSSARNIALNKAQGTGICFLDADDFYSTKTLSIRHQFIMRNPNRNAFFSKTQVLNEQGEKLWDFPIQESFKTKNLGTMPFHLNAFFYKKSSADTLRFKEEISNGEDWFFCKPSHRPFTRSLSLSS